MNKQTPILKLTLLAVFAGLFPYPALVTVSFVLCASASLAAFVMMLLERNVPGRYPEPYLLLLIVNILLIPTWLPGVIVSIGLSSSWLPMEFATGGSSAYQGQIQ